MDTRSWGFLRYRMIGTTGLANSQETPRDELDGEDCNAVQRGMGPEKTFLDPSVGRVGVRGGQKVLCSELRMVVQKKTFWPPLRSFSLLPLG